MYLASPRRADGESGVAVLDQISAGDVILAKKQTATLMVVRTHRNRIYRPEDSVGERDSSVDAVKDCLLARTKRRHPKIYSPDSRQRLKETRQNGCTVRPKFHSQSLSTRESFMLARPKLKRAEPETAIPQKRNQTHNVVGRYVLKVDGQTKASFQEKELALEAAHTIKRAHPIVVVAITDVSEETTERIT